jgi:hypothetical protein
MPSSNVISASCFSRRSSPWLRRIRRAHYSRSGCEADEPLERIEQQSVIPESTKAVQMG